MKEVQDLRGNEVKVFLVGNKIDVEPLRKVSVEDGKLTAKKHDAQGQIEISAKTGDAVENLFEMVISHLLPGFSEKGIIEEDKDKHIPQSLMEPIITESIGCVSDLGSCLLRKTNAGGSTVEAGVA